MMWEISSYLLQPKGAKKRWCYGEKTADIKTIIVLIIILYWSGPRDPAAVFFQILHQKEVAFINIIDVDHNLQNDFDCKCLNF